jgi:hypothetical protein
MLRFAAVDPSGVVQKNSKPFLLLVLDIICRQRIEALLDPSANNAVNCPEIVLITKAAHIALNA